MGNTSPARIKRGFGQKQHETQRNSHVGQFSVKKLENHSRQPVFEVGERSSGFSFKFFSSMLYIALYSDQPARSFSGFSSNGGEAPEKCGCQYSPACLCRVSSRPHFFCCDWKFSLFFFFNFGAQLKNCWWDTVLHHGL